MLRFSLVILVCLAAVVGSVSEETTLTPTSNIENGYDQDQAPTIGNGESETDNLESREEVVEDEPTSALLDDESEPESLDNSEIVNENEGNDFDQALTPALSNEEAESEFQSESQSFDSSEIVVQDGQSESQSFDSSEIVDPDGPENFVEEHEDKGEDEDEEESVNQTDVNNMDQSDKSEGGTEEVEAAEGEQQDNVISDMDDTENLNNSDNLEDGDKESNIGNTSPDDFGSEDENDESEAGDDLSNENHSIGEEEKETHSIQNEEEETFDITDSPTHSSNIYTPYPTVYKQPTLRPATPYFSTGDDPLEGADDHDGDTSEWAWNDSTIEDIEHDKTVIIALSIVFGVMFFFSIFVAFQMLENPEGCCASICRITVACWCGIIRCICYPCRAICGCTSPTGGQHMIVPDDGHFTNDLELS